MRAWSPFLSLFDPASLRMRNHPRWRGARVGLMGGSFNPAHDGHRALALQALKRLRLDAVWWLVSPQNPLKSSQDMAPLARRLQSAARQARHPKMVATDFETHMATRYSVDTVEKIQAYHPYARFVLLLGADSLASLHRWKAWRALSQSVVIAVFARPGYDQAFWSVPVSAWFGRKRFASPHARGWSKKQPPALQLFRLPLNASSATALRAVNPNWALDPLDKPN
jgi:nicotinate-nucleotide adenylyltransferase